MNAKKFMVMSLVMLLMGVSGCCHKSRIILLDSGKAGSSIIIKTKKGQQILDKPNTYTETTSAENEPSAPTAIDPRDLEKQYGSLIHSAPLPPVSFLLYFKSGALDLTDVSRKMFSEIGDKIRKRQPCDISIIGHSDRVGSRESNFKLSLRRAKQVFQWLQQAGIELKNVTIESYGEEDLLVPTPDGVAEPRNRRVEILVR